MKSSPSTRPERAALDHLQRYLPALQQTRPCCSGWGTSSSVTATAASTFAAARRGNALGRVRFNFPNKFLVYQHDTPDKHLSPRKSVRSAMAAAGAEPDQYAATLLNITMPNER
jgi:hypothetical protein